MSTSPRTRLSPQDRRAELMDHAMAAFSELGMTRAGHGDIARSANVSTATVFNYFPTREALTKAVIADLDEFVSKIFAARDVNSPKHPIIALANVMRRQIALQPNRVKTFLNWSVNFAPNLRPAFLEIELKIVRKLTEVIPKRKHAYSDAQIIYAAAKSFAAMLLDEAPDEEIQNFTIRTVEALFRLDIFTAMPNLENCQHDSVSLSDQFGGDAP